MPQTLKINYTNVAFGVVAMNILFAFVGLVLLDLILSIMLFYILDNLIGLILIVIMNALFLLASVVSLWIFKAYLGRKLFAIFIVFLGNAIMLYYYSSEISRASGIALFDILCIFYGLAKMFLAMRTKSAD